jgi:hypothetical protein
MHTELTVMRNRVQCNAQQSRCTTEPSVMHTKSSVMHSRVECDAQQSRCTTESMHNSVSKGFPHLLHVFYHGVRLQSVQYVWGCARMLLWSWAVMLCCAVLCCVSWKCHVGHVVPCCGILCCAVMLCWPYVKQQVSKCLCRLNPEAEHWDPYQGPAPPANMCASADMFGVEKLLSAVKVPGDFPAAAKPPGLLTQPKHFQLQVRLECFTHSA